MNSTVLSRFEAWCERRAPAGPLLKFQRAFAAVWLAYDLLDMALGGTAGCAALGASAAWRHSLLAAQAGLAVCETGLLFAAPSPAWALWALALRGFEAAFVFPLNDFYYYCATVFILSRVRVSDDDGSIPAWIADALLWQTAWIYFATALLKVNPQWLSGGHLFVRHAYLAARGWPYPAPWARFVSTLSGNALLARAGLAAEFGMAALLIFGAPPAAAAALAAAIHGYAAVALNVWFFGASMIAQVALVTRARAAAGK